MENEVAKIPVLRFLDEGSSETEDIVAREFPLTIILNNQELVTLLCTPKDLGYLAVGFLASEGLLSSKSDVKKVAVDDQKGIVRVETGEDTALANELVFKRFITSGCGRGASFYSGADIKDQAGHKPAQSSRQSGFIGVAVRTYWRIASVKSIILFSSIVKLPGSSGKGSVAPVAISIVGKYSSSMSRVSGQLNKHKQRLHVRSISVHSEPLTRILRSVRISLISP